MDWTNRKESFLNLPTPLEYLETISKEQGVHFYIKRDDVMNLGFGGNKLRKLEYILKDARNQNATMIITRGAVQTNHGRLTAAAAAKYGMKCAIVCIGEYPGELSANLLLDRILGAEVIIKKPNGRPIEEQYKELIKQVCSRYEEQGERVYYTPMGGSDEVGSLGYYECAKEIAAQTKGKEFENARLFCSVGSVGTYMGLYCGLQEVENSLHLTGVAIMPFDEEKDKEVGALYKRVKTLLGKETGDLPEFHIEKGYVRGGYNQPSPEVREAVYYMARKEGIFLDPCYTGKCFAGILEMIREGKIKNGETIIFLHTGGGPGLFTRHHREAFEEELMAGVHLLEEDGEF
ncbi:D-cysteine desulfhydrase family protein [Suipraeoptans intestinalis]|uniref:1-aminocyclopropane-1-carboxylate deaminase/D-cysteine desulfhydrase n=1 Tax=Suipraeoptans intestinalis TaxID=2606628 RepID=UPI002A75CA4F|nr:D-cysteine desulfhydrase family protein [Suipraeoptans intestinalis]MDY3121183.1 D-cysteine desulfhydrase family protein [Suipraeoptans intestinalis]